MQGCIRYCITNRMSSIKYIYPIRKISFLTVKQFVNKFNLKIYFLQIGLILLKLLKYFFLVLLIFRQKKTKPLFKY